MRSTFPPAPRASRSISTVSMFVAAAFLGTVLAEGQLSAQTAYPPPESLTVQFATTTFTVSESSATATITVTLNRTSTATVTVNYTTQDGSAVTSSDYQTKTGTLTFQPGEISKTFTVSIVDDTVTEPQEYLVLSLSLPEGSSNPPDLILGSPATAQLIIMDDDPQVMVMVSPNPIVVGVGATKAVTVNTYPQSAESQLTFEIEDPFVAGVSGSAPSLTVTGAMGGTTSLLVKLNGSVISTTPVLAVDATFALDPVYVKRYGSTLVGVSIVPPEAASYVSYSVTDWNIASAMGMGNSVSVMGNNPGSTALNATVDGQVIASITVYCVEVTVTPNPIFVRAGGTKALTVTVQPPEVTSIVTFGTEDPAIATVTGDIPNLTANGITGGSTGLQVWMASEVVDVYPIHSVSVTLSPSTVAVEVGMTAPLRSEVVPSLASMMVTFQSVDTNIATVMGSAPDLTATGVAAGSTTITALLEMEVCAQATVNVTAIDNSVTVTFAPNPIYLAKAETMTVTATVDPAGSPVTYEIADTTIATLTVSGSGELLVTGVKGGTTQLIAKNGATVYAIAPVYVIEVTFSPDPILIPVLEPRLVTPTVIPSQFANNIIYSIDDETIAYPQDQSINVYGLIVGFTQITATFQPPATPPPPAKPVGAKPVEVFDINDYLPIKIKNTNGGAEYDGVTVPAGTKCDTERVAIRADLEAITAKPLPPAGAYKWTIGGTTIKSYNHRIDNKDLFKTIPMPKLDTKEVSFFWKKDEKINVVLEIEVSGKKKSITVEFDVKRDKTGGAADEPATNAYGEKQETFTIYGADERKTGDADYIARRCPNGSKTDKYHAVDNHLNWHAGKDFVIYPAATKREDWVPRKSFKHPTATEPMDGDNKKMGDPIWVWGDRSDKILPTNKTAPFVSKNYTGQAFLEWHTEYLAARTRWATEFGVTFTAPTGANKIPYLVRPTYLQKTDTPTVPTASQWKIHDGAMHPEEIAEAGRFYGYVRLREHKDLDELGVSLENWHGSGHNAITRFKPLRYPNQTDHKISPYCVDESFFDWHQLVDNVRRDYAGKDKAAVTKMDAKIGGGPTITVTFDKRVSVSKDATDGDPVSGTGTTENKICLIAKALKAGGVEAKTVKQVGMGDDKFKIYEFSGFVFVPAPAAGDKMKVRLIDGADDKSYKAIDLPAEQIEVTWMP